MRQWRSETVELNFAYTKGEVGFAHALPEMLGIGDQTVQEFRGTHDLLERSKARSSQGWSKGVGEKV